MHTDRWRVRCAAALAMVVLASCGDSVEGCLAPGPCAGDFPNEPVAPSVVPATPTLEVGASTVLSAVTTGISSPTYQWQRAGIDIAGATRPTYTLPAAQLADDGAAFTVSVRGGFEGRQVALQSSASQLAVSSLPGVVFEDQEFAPSHWATAVISEPATNGPTHAVSQVASGGNPGAWRRVAITMPAGGSRLYVFDAYQPATYDPAQQGAVYRLEIAQHCIALPGLLGVGPTLLIEQQTRRYIAGGTAPCTGTWSPQQMVPYRFGAADFLQVDGPACAAGQACPDFSAAGAPLRVGFANGNHGSAGFAGAVGGFGVDNWKVTVWRR